MSKNVCDNCGWKGNSPDEIDNLEQRVDPGSVVPSGQCPKCGALCYPVKSVGKGEKAVADTVNLLEIFVGVMASLLDGNRNPDKTFLRAMTKTTKKSIKNLKKLIP